MKIYPEFPLHRFKDPMRRAEKKLYDQLAQTDIQGYTLYEAYPSRMAPQLDFGIWLEEVARIALQCKGGIHRVHRGEWQLRTNQGWERKNRSPIMGTRDSAMALREAMERGGGRGVFVIAALIFPDMEYDQFLADRAAEQKVHTLFGYEELVDRLVALADDQKNPLSPHPPADPAGGGVGHAGAWTSCRTRAAPDRHTKRRDSQSLRHPGRRAGRLARSAAHRVTGPASPSSTLRAAMGHRGGALPN